MTRQEIKAKAEHFRKEAAKAKTDNDRNTLLRKARNYYVELEMTGMVNFCERFIIIK